MIDRPCPHLFILFIPANNSNKGGKVCRGWKQTRPDLSLGFGSRSRKQLSGEERHATSKTCKTSKYLFVPTPLIYFATRVRLKFLQEFVTKRSHVPALDGLRKPELQKTLPTQPKPAKYKHRDRQYGVAPISLRPKTRGRAKPPVSRSMGPTLYCTKR